MDDILNKVMGSLVSAYRIETNHRHDDTLEGQKAKIADPLWTLTRQWQLGELQAEDAGSLIGARVTYGHEKMNQFALGQSAPKGLPDAPLEMLVEQEPVPWNWRMRIRAGQQFERILQRLFQETYQIEIEKFRNQFPIEADMISAEDVKTRRYMSLVAGKSINGETLLKGLDDLDPVYEEAARDLKRWYSNHYAQPKEGEASGWQSQTLDYAYRLLGENGSVLLADQYRNGELDWYTCRIRESGTDIMEDAAEQVEVTPIRADFSGQPHRRWWTMEDRAVVDFPKTNIYQNDLARTMLMNYAILHSDDHFVLPLELPVGTLTHVKYVEVEDVFGVKTRIESARVNDPDPLNRWDLYALSQQQNPLLNVQHELLYLPPNSNFREESDAIEWVQLLRDEDARHVFAIEKRISDGWGGIRFLEDKSENASEIAVPGDEVTRIVGQEFKLATEVPDHWIPYLPRRISALGDQIYFERGAIPSAEDDLLNGEVTEPTPQSRVVQESQMLNEATISRLGLQVKVTRQRMRWTDGKTYVWIGRQVVPGGENRKSGLKHDLLTNIIQ